MTPLTTTLETRLGWPLVMLLGVAMVTLAVLASGLAALTGIALVSLGAAGCLAERVAASRRTEWLLLHVLVYGVLYLLFLGAKLHAGGSLPLLLADFIGSLIAIGMLATLLRSSVEEH